jgi:hypothetical protein
MMKTKKLPEVMAVPGLGQLALSGARPLLGVFLGLLRLRLMVVPKHFFVVPFLSMMLIMVKTPLFYLFRWLEKVPDSFQLLRMGIF